MLNSHSSLMKKSLVSLAMLMTSSTAFAQGAGHSGGGNVTEGDLKHFMNKLSIFLQSDEGLNLFPEVKKYNEANPKENFYQVIAKTNPVVVSEKLYDQNGVERDCMSYALPNNRFFKCNKDALPSNELGNQPSLYRIVLHELMVQAGIEMPLNDDVRSAYAVSSRIMDNVHLETYQEWVPGKGNMPEQTFAETGFSCTSWNQQTDPNDIFYFSWKPNGDYIIAYQKFPKGQHNFGRQQRQTNGWLDRSVLNLRQGIARVLGGDVVTEVLYRGNSMELTTESRGRGYMYRQIQTQPSLAGANSRNEKTFVVYTESAIEKMVLTNSRGRDERFVLYLHIWGNTKVPKKYRYNVQTLICSETAENSAIIEKIFSNPQQDRFTTNLIEKNLKE